MKRNLILFLILAGLISAVYVFEEVGVNQKQLVEEERKSFLQGLNMAEIEQIDLPHVQLIKRGGQFYIQGAQVHLRTLPTDQQSQNFAQLLMPVDGPALAQLFERLQNISVYRFLEDEQQQSYQKFLALEEPTFIRMRFANGKKTLAFELGKPLAFEGRFYGRVEMAGKTMAAILTDESNSLSLDSAAALGAEQNYFSLRRLLSMDSEFFYAKSVLPMDQLAPQGDLPVSVIIKNRWNRLFKVNFRPLATSPAILPGLDYNSEAVTQFWQGLQNMRASAIFKCNPAALAITDLESELILQSAQEGQPPLKLELYSAYGHQEGRFVKRSDSMLLYQIENQQALPFYLNMQDFWRKEIRELRDHQSNRLLDFQLRFDDGQQFAIHLETQPQVKVKFAPDSSGNMWLAQHENFKKLLTLLLVMPPLRVDRVSPLSADQLAAYRARPGMEIINQHLHLRIQNIGDELILANVKQHYTLHFFMQRDYQLMFTPNEWVVRK